MKKKRQESPRAKFDFPQIKHFHKNLCFDSKWWSIFQIFRADKTIFLLRPLIQAQMKKANPDIHASKQKQKHYHTWLLQKLSWVLVESAIVVFALVYWIPAWRKSTTRCHSASRSRLSFLPPPKSRDPTFSSIYLTIIYNNWTQNQAAAAE